MPRAKSDFSAENRWGATFANTFTPVPIHFLKVYHKLGITSTEAMVIIHIVSHKWTKELSFPATSTLAERMGITPTAVRNNVRNLESRGLLMRVPLNGKANRYDISPLVKKLKALETLEEAKG